MKDMISLPKSGRKIKMSVYIGFGRNYWFSAAHRLHSPDLTSAKNKKIYDKCNNRAGHGHDYKLEVVVRGEPDPYTGMIIPMNELDAKVDSILKNLNYKHLNKEVEYFKRHISTGENIIGYLWTELKNIIPGESLFHLKLWETKNNYFEIGKE
jgi:6-pyruvoyltetrahydropterin/6-carboxytetrahydropterin synthase